LFEEKLDYTDLFITVRNYNLSYYKLS